MCGLTGFLQPTGFADEIAEQVIGQMSNTIVHRGPDDVGSWLDGDAGIALGHRRLSIIDLSSAGHQPMISASGRFVIAFNGEIYNHLQIRKELQKSESAHQWRGYSDTETLLAAFEHWGIEAGLRKSAGMFAFALWDRQERVLTIARDRMGEKPLYYTWQSDIFLFGSELKALRAHPSFTADIDRDVLAMYMRRGYIEAPYSIYEHVFKLLPGTYLQLATNGVLGTLPEPKPYWSLQEVVECGLVQPFTGSDEDAIDELEARLKNSVALQSVADVPLGAFLSGGIDSTTVVALMQEQTCRQVRTFTIGFHDKSYNEAAHAKLVSQHLGTDHTELYVTSREAMEVIPKLPVLYDEPFGDSSAIPTFLVSQLARQHVTVSLSGDGGDELFGGYTRYKRTADIWSVARRIPDSARKAAAHGFEAFSRLTRG
jgi:asparagine synthase (glutamine-hydrolysing)